VRIKWIGYRIEGFKAVADQALYWDMIRESAEQRLKVLQFWERHDMAGAAAPRERPAARA
jgi:hypothetical protein